MWNVTYILPRGNKAVYRQVPLHSMDDLIDLTRDAAITSIKSHHKRMLHFPERDKACVIPGFVVHHLPPKELMHLGPMSLTPDAESWHSLLQRQGDSSQITLQFTRQKEQKEENDVTSDKARDSISTPSPLEDMKSRHLSLSPAGKTVTTEEEDRDVAVPLSSENQNVVESEVTRLSSHLVEQNSPSPKIPAVLARLREHIGVRPHLKSSSPPFAQNSFTLENSVTPTLREFALMYVLKCMRELSRGGNAGKRNGEAFSLTFMSRSDTVYFAAATVKLWQSRLLLSPASMSEKWIHLPPLLRDAQREYLKNLVGELRSRLCGVAQLERKDLYHIKRESSSPVKGNSCEASSLYGGKKMEKFGAGEPLVLIEEVTYCSFRKPLPLPAGNVTNDELLVSLRVPKYVDVHEEIVIVGSIYTKNSIRFSWWLVEYRNHLQQPELAHGEEKQSPVVLPLDALYLRRCIATFQITPHTFLLIVKPGSLLASRRYRCVLEACEVRTGEVNVSEVCFETFSKGLLK
ncbi:hypothetical protein MOQ_002600 [Trypanosoma cruzi marinkellei]|uniref:Uncharacterized protein n=1 Tax=Trypanosoma cruzi marinkellei TaxID=85056 RepID=K2NXE6_TRYCR|nr:hypothetical protein MOQ_002600 [Trypanosoma cruzi marinkellei]